MELMLNKRFTFNRSLDMFLLRLFFGSFFRFVIFVVFTFFFVAELLSMIFFFSFVVKLQILPSPTTGAFSAQSYNWRNNSEGNQQIVNEENKSFSNFSFQTQQGPPGNASTTNFESSTIRVQQVCCHQF